MDMTGRCEGCDVFLSLDETTWCTYCKSEERALREHRITAREMRQKRESRKAALKRG